jgi:aspartokinase
MDKIPLDGLKLSQELAQITIAAGKGPGVTTIFGRLAQQRINMNLVCVDAGPNGLSGSFCISTGDLAGTRALMQDCRQRLHIIEPVGILTLFPHRARLNLLETVLRAFAQAHLPVHAIASSLSCLSFSMDYHRLEQAVATVRKLAVLPENLAPMKPEFQVRQL